LSENAGKTFKARIDVPGKAKLDPALTKQLLTILFDNAMK